MNPYGGPPPGGAPPGPPPGGGYGQPPGAAMGHGAYEFSDSENVIIGQAARWGQILAIVLFIVAVLDLLNCNPIGAAIDGAIGYFFLKAANSLKSVVDTQGNDVQHMMQSLDGVYTALLIRLIASAIKLAIVILVLIVVVIVAVGFIAL